MLMGKNATLAAYLGNLAGPNLPFANCSNGRIRDDKLVNTRNRMKEIPAKYSETKTSPS